VIDALNRIRPVVGTLMLVGVIVYYSGVTHLATTTVDANGPKQRTVTENTPAGPLGRRDHRVDRPRVGVYPAPPVPRALPLPRPPTARRSAGRPTVATV
jgi:hypothetical protein